MFYTFFFGEGDGTPLQYSCLENPMDEGAWWAAVHGVAKSRTWLSDSTFTFHFHALEKEMATHSSVLAWRIPGMEEPGGLLSMGLQRVGHDWGDLAACSNSSVQFSRSVMSDSLRPSELQHARPPCPSPIPGVYSNLRRSSQWWHPASSSSVVPFSSYPQSLPGSESSSELALRMKWPKYWSFSFSIIPSKEHWSPLESTGWICVQSKGLLRLFSNTTVQKHQFFGTQLSSQFKFHIHTWLLEKP